MHARAATRPHGDAVARWRARVLAGISAASRAHPGGRACAARHAHRTGTRAGALAHTPRALVCLHNRAYTAVSMAAPARPQAQASLRELAYPLAGQPARAQTRAQARTQEWLASHKPAFVSADRAQLRGVRARTRMHSPRSARRHAAAYDHMRVRSHPSTHSWQQASPRVVALSWMCAQ